jgi:hypothetical protein
MKHLIAIVLTALLSGCSTMINGTSQEIVISSDSYEVSDIEIVQGKNKTETSIPAWVTLHPEDKGSPIIVTTEGKCVHSESTTLRKGVAKSYWLNIFNIVGFFIDDATGAMWQYPERTRIQVRKDYQCILGLAATTK